MEEIDKGWQLEDRLREELAAFEGSLNTEWTRIAIARCAQSVLAEWYLSGGFLEYFDGTKIEYSDLLVSAISESPNHVFVSIDKR